MKKTEAAKQAGYSEKNADRAGTVLTSKANPVIQKRINELQTKAADKAVLTLKNHLEDLKDIREGAVRNGAWSAAVTAEVARGKAAGLYVTRSELTVNRVDTMSKEEVLLKSLPTAYSIKNYNYQKTLKKIMLPIIMLLEVKRKIK